MIELILIVVSFVIIIYTILTSKNNKKEKRFEDVLNERHKLDSENLLLFEVKKRDFIDKVSGEISKPEKTYSINSIEDISNQEASDQDKNNQDINNQNRSNINTNNQKISILKDMLEDGCDEVEICQALNIGRGEFLLLKNLYKK